MALKKQIETEFGTIAEYWRIERAEWNKSNSLLHIQLSGYVNEESKNKKPLTSLHFHIDGEILNRTEIYTYLKTQPEFENAEDI